MSSHQPELIVFDLDFTLWDCGGTWCDCLSPPFAIKNGCIVDRTARHIRVYDDVASILNDCEQRTITTALASRTEQPQWARELIGLLEIADRFPFAEIYPSSKLVHFEALAESSKVAFDQMLFFDDEMRNIREVSTLGVTCIHVESGMSTEVYHAGLRRFANRA